MPISREESQRRTRERLIEAALHTVARIGYDAASIGAIADAAGFTKGAFFSNFDCKDTVLLEVLRRHYSAACEDLAALADGSRGHDVDASVDRYVDQLVADVAWCRLNVELGLRASRDPAFAAQYTPLRAQFATALGGFLAPMFAKRGRALPLPPAEMGSLMLAFLQGISLAAASGTSQPSGSAAVNLFLDGLIAGAPPVAGG